MQAERKFWFPAKRYGFGWGLPVTWQGYVVLAVYFVLLALGTRLLRESNGWFVAYAGMLTAILVFVCWLKGEKSAWRWNGK